MNQDYSENRAIDISELEMSIKSIKRVLTQIKGIYAQDRHLLSKRKDNILNQTPDVLEDIIKKKRKLIEKREQFDNRLSKHKKSLDKEMQTFSDTKKLSYILALDRNAFSYFVKTLDEGYEQFLNEAAKKIEYRNISIKEFLDQIEESLKKRDTENYKSYMQEYSLKLKEFGLDG